VPDDVLSSGSAAQESFRAAQDVGEGMVKGVESVRAVCGSLRVRSSWCACWSNLGSWSRCTTRRRANVWRSLPEGASALPESAVAAKFTSSGHLERLLERPSTPLRRWYLISSSSWSLEQVRCDLNHVNTRRRRPAENLSQPIHLAIHVPPLHERLGQRELVHRVMLRIFVAGLELILRRKSYCRRGHSRRTGLWVQERPRRHVGWRKRGVPGKLGRPRLCTTVFVHSAMGSNYSATLLRLSCASANWSIVDC